MGTLKVLHTSDWHLGRRLEENDRSREFGEFLDWLLQTIKDEKIDLLLVAGDVFDTIHPVHSMQKLYYDFLIKLYAQTPTTAVITAGNHDSASLIDAPAELLESVRTFAIGNIDKDNLEREIITIKNAQGQPAAIVAAVPFLHDSDLLAVQLSDTYDSKNERYQEAIAAHYRQIATLAQQKRQELQADIPLIAMGHLFTQGGLVNDPSGEQQEEFQGKPDSGERDLYVGTAIRVDGDIISQGFDYTALGHLHVPQKVGQRDDVQYSGSPLAMGFGEARQQKRVVIIEFEGSRAQISYKDIPVWQKLQTLKGTASHIKEELQALKEQGEAVWVRAICSEPGLGNNLHQELANIVKGSSVQIFRTQCPLPENLSISLKALGGKSLSEITPQEIFMKLLDSQGISAPKERQELAELFNEACRQIEQDAETQARGQS